MFINGLFTGPHEFFLISKWIGHWLSPWYKMGHDKDIVLVQLILDPVLFSMHDLFSLNTSQQQTMIYFCWSWYKLAVYDERPKQDYAHDLEQDIREPN